MTEEIFNEECRACTIVIEPEKKGKTFICQNCKCCPKNMVRDMTDGS